jgi:ABC-type multidrug transport system ATPase subunit
MKAMKDNNPYTPGPSSDNTTTEVAVSFKNITKNYGNQVVLDDVSFDIPKNSVFGIIGPNGAGKTTLFSIAAGFIKTTSGNAHVLGVNIEQISNLMGRFSMLPQDAEFQSGIPVLEQLIMFSELNGMNREEAKEASMEALRIVGLEDVAKKSARSLSHGMSKRVALCQAFIGNPEVIFLDEPTAGLDPDNARNIRELIRKYSENKTIVISSHNLKEIQNICHHVAILDKGKLVENSSMENLVSSRNMIRVELNESLTSDLKEALLSLECVSDLIQTESLAFNIVTENTGRKEALKAIYGTMSGHDVYPKSIQEGESLESRFLEVTGGQYDGNSST